MGTVAGQRIEMPDLQPLENRMRVWFLDDRIKRHSVGLYRQESCRQQRRDEKYASFHIGPSPLKPFL